MAVEAVKVYGASDDLIEVEGAIREEFGWSGEPMHLGFSDGTVLRVSYDGMWSIRRVQAGLAAYDRREATSMEDDYSDVVTLEGDIGWVVAGGYATR